MSKKVYKLEGMDCTSCAMMIESDLEDIGLKANCSFAKATLEVEDSENFDEEKIKKVITDLGYRIKS